MVDYQKNCSALEAPIDYDYQLVRH